MFNMMASIDLETTPRPHVIAELQLEGVKTGPDLIDVVVDAHVPDGENRGEQAVRADLRQNVFSKSCPE